MVYLIATKKEIDGCYALKAEIGDKLAALSKYLTLATLEKGIEILTVSSKESYSEYAPYRIIDNELDFINIVLNLQKKISI
ncbi:hypothetical protein QTH05_15540 [Clostridium perfringens]|uniref:DUF6718 family protein n=1 Tax=Clostridium sp. TaxID=1506 RepID=UPI001A2749CC|nr:DUF6718 family protein [Clostridium sp.]MDM0534872.1 hypothetical protein [Clostridium perfringens]MDO5040329.1 hypothetical protein [Clostridium sp.]HAT4325240.1 hypothetical protein [Clostridium perfringens]